MRQTSKVALEEATLEERRAETEPPPKSQWCEKDKKMK